MREPLATADGAKASGAWSKQVLRAATLIWAIGLFSVLPNGSFPWALLGYGIASLIAGATLKSVRDLAFAVGEMALIAASGYALAYPIEAFWPGSAPWTLVNENETEAVLIFAFAASTSSVLGAFAIASGFRRWAKA
ncbi:MAG: hypothetical protein M0D54_03555 [Hyphomonadaceae bacterium JAD_PAG50586_4]|nr:MAG: hypothetical protein M0D54_03555 [Hyphomonadaceae bacterium JAD_PAG50586_4]